MSSPAVDKTVRSGAGHETEDDVGDFFRVVLLLSSACDAGTIGCLTTFGQWLLIGTLDGRVLFYHVSAPPSRVAPSSSSSPPTTLSPPELSTTLVYTHTLTSRQPVTQLIVMAACHLLVVRTPDAVMMYRAAAPLLATRARPDAPLVDKSEANALVLVAHLTGLAALISVHVRKQRQLHTLALLHRRKLSLYDVRDVSLNALAATAQSVRLSLTREVPLPDGVRCFEWCGKDAILGFRRSYVYLHLSSGATEELSPVGKSAEPFVRAMHPVAEVLVGHDGLCQRTLPDGTAAPGQSAFTWGPASTSSNRAQVAAATTASLRTSVAYSHPFLCYFSKGAGDVPRGSTRGATVDLSLPLLTTLPSETSGVPAVGVGGGPLRLPCVDVACFSHDGLGAVVDLDGPDRVADGGTIAMSTQDDSTTRFSLQDGVVIASDKADVLFLMPASLRSQGMRLASQYGYQAAELLCDLCATRASADDRQLIHTLAAIESFATGHYQAAMQRLRHAQASPVVAISLFASQLASRTSASLVTLRATLPLEVQHALARHDQNGPRVPPSVPAAHNSALVALQGFLLSSRAALRREVTLAHNERLLRCVDTALVQSYAVTGREEAIVDLLHEAHWCVLQETEPCLLDHGLWTAAAALWRSAGDLDKPLQLFRWLALCGVPPTAAAWHRSAPSPLPVSATPLWSATRTPCAVFDALQCVASRSTATEASRVRGLIEGGGPTNAQLQQVIAAATTPDVQACLTDRGHLPTSWPLHLCGVVCALAYVHALSWADEAHVSTLRTHVSWLLGTAPSTWASLALLGNLQNAQHYDRILSVVSASFNPDHGWRTKLDVETALLFAVVEDERLRCADVAVHNACWKNASLLVFTTAPPPAAEARSEHGAAVTAASHVDTARVRAHLDRFLAQSPHIDLACAVHFFEEDELRHAAALERSILYQRLGNHEAAVRMFLSEQKSVSAATEYALRVRRERAGNEGGEAFSALLRLLAHPRDGEDGPRVAEIMHILRTCDGVNVADALPLLPDTLSMTEIGPLLLRGLRDATTDVSREAFYTATLSSRKGRRQERWIAENATHFVVAADSICAVCLRPLRAESVFLRYPNGVLAHPTCVTDERVCPVTHVDFTQKLTATLLDDEQ